MYTVIMTNVLRNITTDVWPKIGVSAGRLGRTDALLGTWLCSLRRKGL